MRVRAKIGGLFDTGSERLQVFKAGDEFDVPEEVGEVLVVRGDVFRVGTEKNLGEASENKAFDEAPENK